MRRAVAALSLLLTVGTNCEAFSAANVAPPCGETVGACRGPHCAGEKSARPLPSQPRSWSAVMRVCGDVTRSSNAMSVACGGR